MRDTVGKWRTLGTSFVGYSAVAVAYESTGRWSGSRCRNFICAVLLDRSPLFIVGRWLLRYILLETSCCVVSVWYFDVGQKCNKLPLHLVNFLLTKLTLHSNTWTLRETDLVIQLRWPTLRIILVGLWIIVQGASKLILRYFLLVSSTLKTAWLSCISLNQFLDCVEAETSQVLRSICNVWYIQSLWSFSSRHPQSLQF